VPSPEAKPGFAVVDVKAVGVNFPDVLIIEDKYQFKPARPFAPGAEVSGIVKSVGEGVTHVKPGDRVLGNTGWGGMAEELALEAARLVKIPDSMPFDDAAAFIMTYGTSYHALKDRADLKPGQTLLIRGGTSALGLAATTLAKDMGATVLATTRNPQRTQDLAAHGVDHPLVDDGAVAGQVRKIVPEGVSAALEVVGTPTLPDTLAAVRVHGTVCFTGMLSDQWTVRDFYPIGYLPNGVRLTAYSGDAADLPAAVLQSYLDRIASGEISLGPVHVYSLDDIQVAHTDLEEGRKVGKLVGRTTGR